jgi:hypothetical protein
MSYGGINTSAVRGYRRTYHEFVEMFPDDAACGAYLEQLRWSRGFVNPVCGGTTAALWRQTRVGSCVAHTYSW